MLRTVRYLIILFLIGMVLACETPPKKDECEFQGVARPFICDNP